MSSKQFAFDKSDRTFDKDGRLHVSKSNISKETVNPYYGYEIPGFSELGLDKNKIYYIYRPGTELKKAADTFNRIQILDEHTPVDANDSNYHKVIGTTGSDAVYEKPYLKNSLAFWDNRSIGAIEEADKGNVGTKELSCGYSYEPVMKSGVFEDMPYDGYMTNIVGNHVALVESGRAGRDVKVADHDIFNKKIGGKKPMKTNKTRKRLQKAVHALDIELDEHQVDTLLDELLKSDQDKYDDAMEDKKDKEFKEDDHSEDAKDAEEADVIHLLKMKGLDDEEIEKVVRLVKEQHTSKDEEIDEPKTCDEDEKDDDDEQDKKDVRKDDRAERLTEKAFASVTDGTIQAADAGSTIAGFIETDYQITLDAAVGELTVITL